MGRGAGPACPRGTGTGEKPARADQASRIFPDERPLTRVRISKEIVERVSGYQGHKKALKNFAETIERGDTPKRVYKPSGVDRKGERFEPIFAWDFGITILGAPVSRC